MVLTSKTIFMFYINTTFGAILSDFVVFFFHSTDRIRFAETLDSCNISIIFEHHLELIPTNRMIIGFIKIIWEHFNKMVIHF